MTRLTTNQIMALPEFKQLLAEQKRLRIPIVAIITIAYFGFIALIAFKPAVLAQTVGNGVVSIGIYIGLSLLVLGFVLCVVYLKVAGKKTAELQNVIRQKAQ